MRTRTAVVVGLVGVIALVTVVGATVVNRIGVDLKIGEPPHLEPIAVPASACPPLALVRVSAARAGEGWLHQFDSKAANWRAFASQLHPKLQVFAAALYATIPRTPRPVAVRLTTVLRDVDIGLRELPGSTDLYQYLSATNFAVLHGQQALSEASDLVGDACGAPLYSGPAQDISA